jgi:anaphase-promoting complex subunit 4
MVEKAAALVANVSAASPTPLLVRLEYQSESLPLVEYKQGQVPPTWNMDRAKSGDDILSCMTFSHVSGFTPVQMDVQRSTSSRGEIPARVCLLGTDKSTYKVFALPMRLWG